MNRLVLEGIPYFGENTLEVEEQIRQLPISSTIEYSDIIELLKSEVTENKVVIIEENNIEYFTYLRDIRFNYRDRSVFIPYFTYKIHEIDRDRIRSNYNGHLIVTDDTVLIRYEYKFNKLNINLKNNKLTVFDIGTNKKYSITFKTWFNKKRFDMEELYKLYLDSCVPEDDYRIVKHTEGYHLISKTILGIKNKERDLRRRYNLNDYASSDISMNILNYRDVRNYRLEEYNQVMGMMTSDEPYWKRILDFESFLFCIANSGAQPIGEIREEWKKLGKSESILKYGKEIKLIIKDYWLNSTLKNNKSSNIGKTWSRVRN